MPVTSPLLSAGSMKLLHLEVEIIMLAVSDPCWGGEDKYTSTRIGDYYESH